MHFGIWVMGQNNKDLRQRFQGFVLANCVAYPLQQHMARTDWLQSGTVFRARPHAKGVKRGTGVTANYTPTGR